MTYLEIYEEIKGNELFIKVESKKDIEILSPILDTLSRELHKSSGINLEDYINGRYNLPCVLWIESNSMLFDHQGVNREEEWYRPEYELRFNSPKAVTCEIFTNPEKYLQYFI